jgi:anti-sigma-K factor RskA
MDDHEAIHELLAGYVLQALSDEDAVQADRLLSDHVPACAECRATLVSFQAVMGDLGAVADPVTPPETLLPRLHRSLDDRRRRVMPSWNPGRLVAAAAAVVVVVGIAGLAVTQVGGRDSAQLLTQADLDQATTFAARPDAEVTDLGEADEITAPGREEVYVMGTSVSPPPAGFTYRLWALNGERADYVGDFQPIAGVVVLELSIDASVERLLVTVEPSGSEPGSPGQPAWSATG